MGFCWGLQEIEMHFPIAIYHSGMWQTSRLYTWVDTLSWPFCEPDESWIPVFTRTEATLWALNWQVWCLLNAGVLAAWGWDQSSACPQTHPFHPQIALNKGWQGCLLRKNLKIPVEIVFVPFSFSKQKMAGAHPLYSSAKSALAQQPLQASW